MSPAYRRDERGPGITPNADGDRWTTPWTWRRGHGAADMAPLFVPRQALLEAVNKTGRGQVVLVRTVAGDPASVSAVGKALEAVFSQRNMKVQAVATRQSERALADSRHSIVISMVLTLACIVALVGGIGLMGALSIPPGD